jgi:hypothetical protein
MKEAYYIFYETWKADQTKHDKMKSICKKHNMKVLRIVCAIYRRYRMATFKALDTEQKLRYGIIANDYTQCPVQLPLQTRFF